MTTIPDIVAWHPVLTDHQAFTLEEMARASNAHLTVYVAHLEDGVRKAQGWTLARTSSLDIRVLPARNWLSYVRRALRQHSASIHLFGSPFEQPRMMMALFVALAGGLRVYLVAEPYSPIGAGYFGDRERLSNAIKSRLRPLVYRCYGVVLRGRVEGVFAISRLACAQYRAIGIPQEKIFPFGYFVPSAKGLRTEVASPLSPAGSANATVRVVFVGSLIARKGVDQLVGAVGILRGEGIPIRADVFGPGDASSFTFDEYGVRYCGQIPFGEAQQVIAGYDALVLPSRFDGWGVVVNEALMAGVPVVCSDRVGAGAVIEKWGCGKIFGSPDMQSLASALKELAFEKEQISQMRSAALSAAAALDPTVAGRYMTEVFWNRSGRGPRPPCPWYDY